MKSEVPRQVRFLLPELGSKTPRILQIIQRYARSPGERLQASRQLFLDLADVGPAHAKLTGKSPLRGSGADLETHLPDPKLDNQGLAVRAQPES
jgi:hypothetical protein